MPSSSRILLLFFLLSLTKFLHTDALRRHYEFIVRETSYTRLCVTKDILTVNGQFPGPTLYAYEQDTIYVKVHNYGTQNITIHWHGVKQPRNPWSDGPEYITQCPIQPGDSFYYKLIFSIETGTLWWHAHSDWSRATVHGAIVLRPKSGIYPFPKPYQEVPIILGEWWNEDIMEVLEEFVTSGGVPNNSDAYTINGQPGDLYPCSSQDTFKLDVTYGKRYLLRMVNAMMNGIMFFGVANHSLTVVGADASYTKPVKTDYVLITPGQTLDLLLETNQVTPGGRYYMAARAYTSANAVPIDNTTTTCTAIIQYSCDSMTNSSTTPLFPILPNYNDTTAAYDFLGSLRSLEPLLFPLNTFDTRLISTVATNTFPCQNNSCAGPNGTRLGASMNNISFQLPSIDILDAYYYHIYGVFGTRFPSRPPYYFNFTDTNLPMTLLTPERATEVRVIAYNLTVELVFQNTRLLGGFDHPMHLHGTSFYVVGWGFGNFNESRDPLSYNQVDPPLRNTVLVPINGWAAIRFKAHNPGVWFLHCHLERHVTWGMETVFIVKEGNRPEERMLPPPRHRPRC